MEESTEKTSYPQLRTIINDTIELANFALQQGRLPQESKLADIYDYQRKIIKHEELSEADIRNALEYYELLRRMLINVTPDTLRDTNESALKNKGGPIKCYLKTINIFTALAVLLILLFNMANGVLSTFFLEPGEDENALLAFLSNAIDATVNYAIPFTYGTLGSCAYLLRVTEKHLRQRDFDVARITEHYNRLVLGTLSGGVIVLFVQDIPTGDGGVLNIAQAALGFLAGYSIDFLFDTLDRIIKAILPKVGIDSVQKRTDDKSKELRIRRIQDMKNKAETDEAQKLLEEVIEYEQMG